MSENIAVGLDLAKNVVQVHGAEGARSCAKAAASSGSRVFQPAADVRYRHGSLRRRPRLGPRDRQARSRSATVPTSLRQTVCEATKE